MKTSYNEIAVNTARQKALINHFIKDNFGNDAVREKVKKYTDEEYIRVLEDFTSRIGSELRNAVVSVAMDLHNEDKEILLSFLKHEALNFLHKNELVSIKDHLAYHIAVTAMFRRMENDIDLVFRHDPE